MTTCGRRCRASSASLRWWRPKWVAEGPPAPDRTQQRELAQAIRAGQADERWNDVVRQVRDDVRDRLAVAHSRYDDFADDGKDKEP